MRFTGHVEAPPSAGPSTRDGVFLVILRRSALIAMIAGAPASLALMLWVGHRNPSILLLILFVLWVTAPFVALGVANRRSTHWPRLTRTALYGVTLAITLTTVVSYGDVVLRPPKSTPASRFLLVPAASWVLLTIVLLIAAYVSRRQSRRGARA